MSILKPINIAYDKYINSEDVKEAEKMMAIAEFVNRTIIIQDIDDEAGVNANSLIRYWNFKDDEAEIPLEKRRPIKIYIDSPGGSLISSLTIVDSIKMSRTPIWTINIGAAYSGGFFIFISGHKRFSYPNASFLFHEGMINTGGDAHKFQNQADFYKKQREQMKELVVSKTKITEEEYRKHEKDDWWFLPKEALDMGIVDEIATSLI